MKSVAPVVANEARAVPQAALLSAGRIRLYCLALFIIGLPLFPATLAYVNTAGNGSDWGDFWTAGSTVGTTALLDSSAHAAWGHAHHLPASAFVYVPGAAWFLTPAAHLSLATSFIANAAVMLLICGVAAIVAAKTYRVEMQVALFAIVGWAPTTAAVLTGQNSPLGLLFALLAIVGFTRNRPILTGFAVGMLLYKPTYAVAFILLLVAFRQWSALTITAGFGAIWYLLSVAATAGDWAWPLAYYHVVAAYVGPDFAGNAVKAISLPGMLLRAGIPLTIAASVAAMLLVWSTVLFARVPKLEAASVAGLIGLAASTHAWPYDAVVMLPALFYAAGHMRDPYRRWALYSAYVVAPLWAYSKYIGFDPLAVVVLGSAATWLAVHLRAAPLGAQRKSGNAAAHVDLTPRPLQE